jgi:flavin-dependent dehydrogenase
MICSRELVAPGFACGVGCEWDLLSWVVADMPKSNPPLDVLVLGEHPAAYVAAAALLDKPGLHVAHATIPTEHSPDRLALVNPEVFHLHKLLEKARKKLALTQVYGAAFLGDDVATRGEYRSKNCAALIGDYAEVRKAFCQVAKEAGAKLYTPKSLAIEAIHERGFEVQLDSHHLRPSAVLLAGALPPEQAKVLALPEMFGREVMRRYSFVRCKSEKYASFDAKPVLPMSLDLNNKLTWAWLLPGEGEMQLAVEQPIDDDVPPVRLLEKWADVLRRHGVLKQALPIAPEQVQTMEIPAAGALSREIIGNRTLLFGPAGGFFTACLEDIYPNCWSAMFAADAVKKALSEPHLQDALQPYRQKWGTTLGEYLRGPQQNLRFLLPLVYRNPVMTSRLAESILQGKSVVR